MCANVVHKGVGKRNIPGHPHVKYWNYFIYSSHYLLPWTWTSDTKSAPIEKTSVLRQGNEGRKWIFFANLMPIDARLHNKTVNYRIRVLSQKFCQSERVAAIISANFSEAKQSKTKIANGGGVLSSSEWGTFPPNFVFVSSFRITQ